MKTTKEMAEIMLAYERGEQIEFMPKNLRSSANWTTMTQEPEWNWSDFDYRVKPKPTYRPYKNVAEFFAAQKEHGMNIRRKGCNYYILPLYITDNIIGIPYLRSDDSVINVDKLYGDLLREYTWQDGTPCGVKES